MEAIDLTSEDDHLEECPVCNQLLSLALLPDHVEAHFAEEAALPAAAEPGVIKCDTCGHVVALSEWDSHALAHELERDELGAAQLKMVLEDEEEAGARGMEELYFKQLREKYGFEQAERPGNCHLCGQPGHWARECPRNQHNVLAQARIVDPHPPAILATQRPAGCTPVPGGLVCQLAACLEQQGNVPASVAYQALLCGPVNHYQGEAHDGGWGCGYRNLQMQLSNLLLTREEARQALFGGCGYVPDIPALQAWLECAWREGFDPHGSEQLGGRVQGSRKWIGTTEAAAVLRYFGLRACIVDFGTPRDQLQRLQQVNQQQQQQQQGQGQGQQRGPQQAASGASSSGGSAPGGAAATEVHPNVECDGCGRCPILGPRYRSLAVPNYDLCGSCHEAQQAGPMAPFERMMAGRVHLGGPQQQQATVAAAGSHPHDKLMQWVWNYFSSPPHTPQQQAQEAERAEQALPAAANGGWADRPSALQQEQQQPPQQLPAGVSSQQGDVWIPDSPVEGGSGFEAAAKRPRTEADERAGPSSAAAAVPGAGGGFSQRPTRLSDNPDAGRGGEGGSSQQLRQLHLPWGSAGGGGGAVHQQQPGQQQGQPGQQQPGQQRQRGNVSVSLTSHPPLYFQHEGHSRTIIGIEWRTKQGKGPAAASPPEYTLLVLDPGCPTAPLAEALQQRKGWQRMVKRGQHTLRQPQYQLLYCAPGVVPPGSREYESLKIIAAAERY